MPIDKCLEIAIDKIPYLKGREVNTLMARREALKKENNLSDIEADRAIKHEIAEEVHAKLHEQMNELREQARVKKVEYKKPQPQDISDINKKYDEDVKAITSQNNSINQQSNKPTEKTIATNEVVDDLPQNAADKLQSKPVGKYEQKARKLAEKIDKAELPSWLRADLPEGTQTQGASTDQLKKALANATIQMGKLLDKGVEFSQAVKQAVKELVDLLGEDKRTSIEEGFAKEYEAKLNDLSGIRKVLVADQVIEGVDLERVSDKDMMALGRKILDTGEVKPEELVTKIITEGKGVLTPTEVVALITYKRDIDSQLQSTYKKLNAKKEAGEDVGTLGVEAANLERQIDDFDVMAVITANQQSMAFRLRQRMLDRDYNVVTQIEKYKKNNDGYIPAEVEARFRELDKQLKEVKAKLAEAEERADLKEGQEAVNNIKESVGREKKYTEEELQDALKKERAENRKSKKEKVHKSIDDTLSKWAKKLSADLPKGTQKQGVGIEQVFKAVGTTMKKAYDAGEVVATIIQDAIDYISEKLGNNNWGIDEFKNEWEDRFAGEPIKKAKDKPTINDDGTVFIPNQMIRDLVQRGITDINDLTDTIHEQVVKELPDITKRQVRDSITDYGKKINPTADELQQGVNTAKRVGRLLSELEDLQNEKRKEKNPNTAAKLSEKERELKRKIRSLERDLFGKEELSDNQKLSNAKERVKSRISELERKIKNKDFAKPQKKLETTDKELTDLNTKKEKLQEQFDDEQYKLELKNRGFWQKAEDIGLELFSGLVRGLVASVDLSAGLIQGFWRLFTNPIKSWNAFGTMFKHLISQKASEDYLAKLKSSKIYPLLQASKLAIDDKAGHVSAKEGLFISNWINFIWDKIVSPIIGIGNKRATEFIRQINPYAASQRAFDGYVNSIRVESFSALAKQLEKDGYTFESDPKVFQKAADFVNTTTGRGGLGAADASSRWLNILLFAPRKVISEIKLFTPYAFVYYGRMPKPVRMKALKNVATFAVSYFTVNALLHAALKPDDDDEKAMKIWRDFWNTDSSNFLTHAVGNKRINIGGGMKSMLVFLSRLWGNDFGDQYGNETKLGERYGKTINTKLDLSWRFLLGKASPTIGVIAKKLDEKKGIEMDASEAITNLSVPIWMQDLKEMYKQDPATTNAFLNVLSILGANVRAIEPKKSAFTPEEINDPTLKIFIDKGISFPNYDPKKIQTKEVNGKVTEHVSDYDPKEQEAYINAHKDYYKEELRKLKDGDYSVYRDENGTVHIKGARTNISQMTYVPFDDLTDSDVQYLEGELTGRATDKTKADDLLKTKKQ